LITDIGTAVLADFGLSRVSHEATTSTLHGAGSARWMAPELILAGDTIIDPLRTQKSDVYAYGHVMLEVPGFRFSTTRNGAADVLEFISLGFKQQVALLPLEKRYTCHCPAYSRRSIPETRRSDRRRVVRRCSMGIFSTMHCQRSRRETWDPDRSFPRIVIFAKTAKTSVLARIDDRTTISAKNSFLQFSVSHNL
jgi:serine/threonine protein kinase